MNIKKISMILVICLFIPISVYADNSYINCTDNQTLIVYNSINFDGEQYNFTENISCEFGCYGNECLPNPFITDLIIIIFTVVMGIIIWTWNK